MNCDECNELICAFIDNDLEEGRASMIRAHLAFCPPCAAVCEEVTSLIDVCRTESPNELIPPNSRQMWQRINNVIENEVKVVPVAQPVRRSWAMIQRCRDASALCCRRAPQPHYLLSLRHPARLSIHILSTTHRTKLDVHNVVAADQHPAGLLSQTSP